MQASTFFLSLRMLTKVGQGVLGLWPLGVTDQVDARHHAPACDVDELLGLHVQIQQAKLIQN